MAVQKSRKTRSKRGMRRSHDALGAGATLSVDELSGEKHLRHHGTADGVYRGRKVVVSNNQDWPSYGSKTSPCLGSHGRG